MGAWKGQARTQARRAPSRPLSRSLSRPRALQSPSLMTDMCIVPSFSRYAAVLRLSTSLPRQCRKNRTGEIASNRPVARPPLSSQCILLRPPRTLVCSSCCWHASNLPIQNLPSAKLHMRASLSAGGMKERVTTQYRRDTFQHPPQPMARRWNKRDPRSAAAEERLVLGSARQATYANLVIFFTASCLDGGGSIIGTPFSASLCGHCLITRQQA